MYDAVQRAEALERGIDGGLHLHAIASIRTNDEHFGAEILQLPQRPNLAAHVVAVMPCHVTVPVAAWRERRTPGQHQLRLHRFGKAFSECQADVSKSTGDEVDAAASEPERIPGP